MERKIERTQIVARDIADVVEFFEDPRNLEAITPSFLGFRILTEGPIVMQEGAIIDYSIRLHGVPMLWKTRIEEYVPGVRFVDNQLKGPYRLWHHTHTFESVPGGTKVSDTVRYELPYGLIGEVAHALFVRRQLKAIFDHRQKVVEKMFG